MFPTRTVGWVGCLLVTVLGVGAPAVRGQEPGGRQGTRYALLIGVDKYENKEAMQQPDLSCAENDAGTLSQVLEQNGYDNANIRLFVTLGKKDHPLYPRSGHIRTQLKEMARACKEGDTILFYFGGYERQFPDTRDYFLCTADANPADRSSMLALSEVYQELGKCKASLKLVVLDSCRGRETGLIEPPEGVATFFACSTKEVANEDAKLKHGFFTYVLLDALRGAADANQDGKVTVTELERYVPRRVSDLARKEQHKQTPEMLGDTSRRLPVVTLSRR